MKLINGKAYNEAFSNIDNGDINIAGKGMTNLSKVYNTAVNLLITHNEKYDEKNPINKNIIVKLANAIFEIIEKSTDKISKLKGLEFLDSPYFDIQYYCVISIMKELPEHKKQWGDYFEGIQNYASMLFVLKLAQIDQMNDKK